MIPLARPRPIWNGFYSATTFSLPLGPPARSAFRPRCRAFTGSKPRPGSAATRFTATAPSWSRVDLKFRPACNRPPLTPTCIYLGALYSAEVKGAGGPISYSPYVLASFTEEIFILPGTTHVSFDLDPNQNTVDNEVVVRTATGNYTLRSALTTEDVGYDYRGGTPLIPAPRTTASSSPSRRSRSAATMPRQFNFRVRVKCWRNDNGPIYAYTPCPYSKYPGGAGPALPAVRGALHPDGNAKRRGERPGPWEQRR
jgi:hypothetical protein